MAENWICGRLRRDRIREVRTKRWTVEVRWSSELSRHAKTKTDGEFTPALCAWIIHAPPGLSPGWTAAVLLSSVSFRGRPSATDDDAKRNKKKIYIGKKIKKESWKRTIQKRRARLTKRMDQRWVRIGVEPVVLNTTRVFLFWCWYYVAFRLRVTFDEMMGDDIRMVEDIQTQSIHIFFRRYLLILLTFHYC